MKCPKCSYLGFETGDRCKNCGYDFSLLATPHEPPDPDLNLQMPEETPSDADRSWMDRLRTGLEEVTEAHEMPEAALADPPSIDPTVAARTESAFPLFEPRDEDDDEPLVKFPAAPRPPLSVRRTPEQPRLPEQARLRSPSRPGRPDGPPLSLEFADEPYATVPVEPVLRHPVEPAMQVEPDVDVATAVALEPEVSSLSRRVAAGLTDHLILFGIDLVVLYSTLRMAGLTMADWQLLPPVPMIGFLLLLKLSYFGAFTAACGQTIGKMAAHIRVVADDAPLDPSRAVGRTMMSGLSLLALGAGFIPALIDPEHRALHDRMARTRVVELPSELAGSR
jgi:uncharacterized RDD family membrane protein YckC